MVAIAAAAGAAAGCSLGQQRGEVVSRTGALGTHLERGRGVDVMRGVAVKGGGIREEIGQILY